MSHEARSVVRGAQAAWCYLKMAALNADVFVERQLWTAIWNVYVLVGIVFLAAPATVVGIMFAIAGFDVKPAFLELAEAGKRCDDAVRGFLRVLLPRGRGHYWRVV